MTCSVLPPLSGQPPPVFHWSVHGTGLLHDLKGERVLQENFALSTHNFYKENPDIPTSDCTRRDHHTGPGTAIGTHKSFMPTHVGQQNCWVSTLVSLSALTPAGHVPFKAEDFTNFLEAWPAYLHLKEGHPSKA